MSLKQVEGNVNQAFRLNKEQRVVGFQKVIHLVAQNIEFGNDVGVLVAKRLQERTKEFVLGGLLRRGFVEGGGRKILRERDQFREFGEEYFFHRSAHAACAGAFFFSRMARGSGMGSPRSRISSMCISKASFINARVSCSVAAAATQPGKSGT